MNYIGSIIGDYCGSIYEFDNVDRNNPPIAIELFRNGSFTDDTICSMAIMEWLYSDCEKTSETLVPILRKWCNSHNNVGYGPLFKRWLMFNDNKPIESYGNGAAMRVAPCAYYANTLEECLELAERSALASHGHEFAINGAKAIAEAIYLARSGAGKEDIGKIITQDFGYDLNKSINDIGAHVHGFNATAQVTVPEAIICFLNSDGFTDCIEKSIWIGGDSDTIAAMSGGIAEAYYGIPHCIMEDIKNKMPDDIKECIRQFNKCVLDR